jgi:DNA-binding Lrp family transcriptional regulator
MDELSRELINRYQGGLPIVERPFLDMAVELDSDEATVISTINKLLNDKILSRFGPLYNAACLGGGLTLAALSVPENDYSTVSIQVNSLPEVAHNYRREHELNMWFVIATETPDEIESTIQTIESLTGLKVYNFPKLREYYLGLWLSLDKLNRVSTRSFDVIKQSQETEIDALDRKIIQHTQSGLALIPEPFAEIARQCQSDVQTIMHRINAMLDCGIIRRIGAVPNHYRLGLRSNGMSVWNVRDERLHELGERVGQLDFVSHCYQRPRHLPLWPYNLFAMVHGYNQDEVHQKVEQIAALLDQDCSQHEVLFSSAILKKSGLRLVA